MMQDADVTGDFEAEPEDLRGRLGVVCDKHTNRIFVGTCNETLNGLNDVQQEVTKTALAAVASFVHARGGAVQFSTEGFIYQVQVVKIVTPGPGSG